MDDPISSFGYSLPITCFLLWGGLWSWLFWRRKSQFTMRQAFVMFTGFVLIPAILRAAYTPGRIPFLGSVVGDFGPWAFAITALMLVAVLVIVVLRTVK
jgi:uncharacterized membrane protein